MIVKPLIIKFLFFYVIKSFENRNLKLDTWKNSELIIFSIDELHYLPSFQFPVSNLNLFGSGLSGIGSIIYAHMED